MDDRDEIRLLLERFEAAGLQEKNVEKLRDCFSSHILGVGLGEQGFVTSVQDVEDIYRSTLKEDDDSAHILDYGRVEIMLQGENFGVVCAEIFIESHSLDGDKKISRSQFLQSLTVIREDGKWKICGLHASSPTVTEEWMESYPLKFAEKSLRALKEKIGEEVYRTEEQYRKAVLADTIAFYIVNFSRDTIEKCQIQSDLCAFAEPGTPYETFIRKNVPSYVQEEDRQMFLHTLSLQNIEEAFHNNRNETVCEYRMKDPDGKPVWARTIIRLIRDVKSGDKKGIMYVKNIDKEKQEVHEFRLKADRDGMTGLLNKAAMGREVSRLLAKGSDIRKGVFLMVDVDNFKQINDTFGHPAGDQVLVGIAGLLNEMFPSPSLTGRLGGDEFGIYLPDRVADADIRTRAQSLLDMVGQLRLNTIPQLSITVSAGGAQYHGSDFEELYKTADTAMYRAKKSGKNSYYII